MSCGACDNTKESYFKNGSEIKVQQANLDRLGPCIQFIRYLDQYKKTLNTALDFAKTLGKDVTSVQSALNTLDLSGTEGCENSNRILQAVQPQTTSNTNDIFQWDMSSPIHGTVTAYDNWEAYLRMPQDQSNQTIKMSNTCMQSAPFKRMWEKMMFGQLDNSAMYENIKPLFSTLQTLSSLFSNQTATRSFSRFMGPSFSSSFGRRHRRSGGRTRIRIKLGKRHLQTVQVSPTVKASKNGIDLQNYQNDVQDVPTELQGDSDQSSPGFSNLLKITIASFIVLVSMIV